MITIDGPRTLTLSPMTLMAVLDALSELPFKKANPAIVEITTQLHPTPAPELTKEPPKLSDENPPPSLNGQ